MTDQEHAKAIKSAAAALNTAIEAAARDGLSSEVESIGQNMLGALAVRQHVRVRVFRELTA